MYGIIYKATNKINGKVYIGQTIQGLCNRKAKHYHKSSLSDGLHFHNALRKYNKNDFKWEQIDSVNTKEYLDENEKYYIFLYNSNKSEKGYNLTTGGGGSNGYKHSDDVKYRMRTTKRKPYPRGFSRTKESIDKQSKTRMGIKPSIETRNKIRLKHLGKKRKPHTLESKLKISLKKRKVPWTQARWDSQIKRKNKQLKLK